MKTFLRTALAALIVPLSLLGSAQSADADTTVDPIQPIETHHRVVVRDPTGDATGTAPQRLLAASDVTSAVYKVIPNRVTDTPGRNIRFVIYHGDPSLKSEHDLRAVTTFTGNGKHFKAVARFEGCDLFVQREGRWVEKRHVRIAGDAGSDFLGVEFPVSALKNVGQIKNMKSTLRLDGGAAQDSTATATQSLRLLAIR